MDNPKLDELQQAYKQAVDKWVAAIRAEEALAPIIPRSLWSAGTLPDSPNRTPKPKRNRHVMNIRTRFAGSILAFDIASCLAVVPTNAA
jgi:hypothetical protein